MISGHTVRIGLTCLLGLIALTAGSCIYIEGDGFASAWTAEGKAQRQVELSAPLPPDLSSPTFSAQTNDGAITVDGREAAEYRVVATIRTSARTQEDAEALAEQIQVRLEPSSRGVVVVTDRPAVIRNAGFGVSLDVTAPRQTNLELVTNDGTIHLRNIQGQVSAKTSDGDIDAGNTAGDMVLRTSDGSIRLNRARAEHIEARTSDGHIRGQDIAAANVICHTSDGSIVVALAADAPTAPQIEMTTSDGHITLTASPGLSATIDASTSDGTVHSDLPLTVRRQTRQSLQGTAGAGAGHVRLRTSDGSITIR